MSYEGKIAFPPRSYNGAEREERGREKHFHILAKRNCFTCFIGNACYYPLRREANKNPGWEKGVTGRYECNPFMLGG
jgi:hypothetical protein